MLQYGATFTIDASAMMGASQTVDTQRGIIENCFNSIIKDASSLKSEWEGDSADAYQEAIEKIAENAPKVASVFQEYALDLKEIASNYMTEEQKRKAENEALPATIFGE